MMRIASRLAPSLPRIILGVVWLALLAGLVIHALAPRPPRTQAAPRQPDTREAAYEEARQMVLENLKDPATAAFSDYATDEQTGAAEIGRGIWEAWGRVNSKGSSASTDWHIAWIRKTKQILYQKIGDEEKGNYATALEASGTFPSAPAAAD